ncbi:MAG: hypothetical protein MUE54_11910 [Anaerolineae bacterium]|nr:hypothetical protein [Anaerolineae bacterium]
MSILFDEVMQLARKLSLDEQNLLIQELRLKQLVLAEVVYNPTREELIEELNTLRASGAFNHVESLYGKYANPNIPEISEAEFHAQMHAIATEWEQS